MDEKIELKLTKGNILRLLNVLFICIFFMPTMLVSCSGQTVEISASKATFGFEVLGEKVDGNIVGIIMLIIPIVCLVLLCLKNTRTKKFSVVTSLILNNIVNFLVWVTFSNAVDEKAQEAYCKSEMTGWFILLTFGFLVHLIVGILTLILWNKKSMPTTNGIHTSGSVCPSCGAQIKPGDAFCLKCGSKLKNICPTCGADVDLTSKFCAKCGTEIKE